MINTRKLKLFLKFIIIVMCFFGIFMFIVKTMSKYESSVDAYGDIEVAFYILDENYQNMSLNLSDLTPREEPYIYTFSISNNDGTHRAQTDLQYDLEILTTTNLPLSYELYLNQNYNDDGSINIITENNVSLDEYGTYFRYIKTDTKQFSYTENETNVYNLIVYFPSEYKLPQYQNIMELIEIKVNSKQII